MIENLIGIEKKKKGEWLFDKVKIELIVNNLNYKKNGKSTI